ncbi:MAG: hypothetical protein JNM38_20815 [Acidobacteria bacterium]|jgi:hypothetical protein|nr:hypothetical protein [Acidobacteriota bacterium]
MHDDRTNDRARGRGARYMAHQLDHLTDLLGEIREAYRALPGLNITFEQAQRLFRCDAARCRAALDWLIADGVIVETASRTFARAQWAPAAG